MTKVKFTAILAGSLFAVSLAAPGLAQDDQFNFAVDRQDIQSDSEARATYASLHAAADAYCAQFIAAEQCVAAMTAAVVEQIDNPAFTAVHVEESQAEAARTLTASYTAD